MTEPIPLSFEATLDERLRTVPPQAIAALLNCYLLSEVVLTYDRTNGVAVPFLPVEERAERFELTVRGEGFPADVEQALRDAACHMLFGEDVVGTLLRIAQRAVTRRAVRLTDEEQQGLLKLDIADGEAGRLAFSHVAKRYGHRPGDVGPGRVGISGVVKAAFDAMDNEMGFAASPERRRMMARIADRFRSSANPGCDERTIRWLETDVGPSVAAVIVDRLLRFELLDRDEADVLTRRVPGRSDGEPYPEDDDDARLASVQELIDAIDAEKVAS